MENNLSSSAIDTIREELGSYLKGEQSIDEFCDWFFPETWDIHQWAPLPAQVMAGAIKLLLDEYTSGVWSETELREKLRSFVISLKPAGMTAERER